MRTSRRYMVNSSLRESIKLLPPTHPPLFLSWPKYLRNIYIGEERDGFGSKFEEPKGCVLREKEGSQEDWQSWMLYISMYVCVSVCMYNYRALPTTYICQVTADTVCRQIHWPRDDYRGFDTLWDRYLRISSVLNKIVAFER